MTPTPPDLPTPPAYEPVHPELLAWARQTFDEREFLEGMREIEETGVCTFETIFAEVEAIVRGS